MSQFGGDIIKLTSPELPNSLNTWIILLDFFESHKDYLDLKELNIMANKSESIRSEWNKTHVDVISKHEVSPNICKYVDCLRITLYDRAE